MQGLSPTQDNSCCCAVTAVGYQTRYQPQQQQQQPDAGKEQSSAIAVTHCTCTAVLLSKAWDIHLWGMC